MLSIDIKTALESESEKQFILNLIKNGVSVETLVSAMPLSTGAALIGVSVESFDPIRDATAVIASIEGYNGLSVACEDLKSTIRKIQKVLIGASIFSVGAGVFLNPIFTALGVAAGITAGGLELVVKVSEIGSVIPHKVIDKALACMSDLIVALTDSIAMPDIAATSTQVAVAKKKLESLSDKVGSLYDDAYQISRDANHKVKFTESGWTAENFKSTLSQLETLANKAKALDGPIKTKSDAWDHLLDKLESDAHGDDHLTTEIYECYFHLCGCVQSSLDALSSLELLIKKATTQTAKHFTVKK